MDQVGCYLFKHGLDGRTSSEAIHGQTPDISIFRFAWFQPVWYYDPTLSFPQDRMSPGFFLKLAENTDDSFAYVVLPAQSYDDIPRRSNPVTLVRCVVRQREMSETIAPKCIKVDNAVKFYNAKGRELLAK